MANTKEVNKSFNLVKKHYETGVEFDSGRILANTMTKKATYAIAANEEGLRLLNDDPNLKLYYQPMGTDPDNKSRFAGSVLGVSVFTDMFEKEGKKFMDKKLVVIKLD